MRKNMKHTLLYLAAGLGLAACSTSKVTNPVIEVKNPCDFARHGELVEIAIPEDIAKLGKIVDAQGNEVAYQITADGRLLFQADVEANATAEYQLLTDASSAHVTPKTTAFFLGDRRKDDFCWENDKAAYRMYGPALLPENPSSGVDLWLKHSAELTADAMYKQEEGGKPYHIDYGLGIDSYKVGHAAGCGGVGIVANGEIWPGGPFARYEILQEGPLQTIFRLEYDSVQVCDKVWKETITITVNAGAQVNKAEVCFTGEPVEGAMVGGALFLHDEPGNAFIGKNGDETTPKYFAYAEPATSDKGIYGIHQKAGIDASTLDFGRNYVVVMMEGVEEWEEINNTVALVKPYQMGDTYTYFFGGGWSKRDFATDEEWFEASRQTSEALSHPLEVNLKK